MLGRIQQSIAQSPSRDADAFAFAIWVGTIGGPALGVDPNPNTTPPAAGRIVRLSAKRGGTIGHGFGSLRIVFGVVAASSITVQGWFFDTTQNQWVQLAQAQTITPTGAATNTASYSTANMVGAKLFVQITANTLVQAMGYDTV